MAEPGSLVESLFFPVHCFTDFGGRKDGGWVDGYHKPSFSYLLCHLESATPDGALRPHWWCTVTAEMVQRYRPYVLGFLLAVPGGTASKSGEYLLASFLGFPHPFEFRLCEEIAGFFTGVPVCQRSIFRYFVSC